MGSILGGVLANLSMSILCSRLVGAVVTEKSETADVIQEAKRSIVVKPENVAGIWSAVLPLKKNAPARVVMGKSGRDAWGRNMDPGKNLALYEKSFNIHAVRILSSRGGRFLRGMRMH